MSQAFVKEEEAQWLHDIQPTMNALINYLTWQNNGIRVYEKSSEHSVKHGRSIHHMSNGISYIHNEDGKWMMVM